VSVLAVRAPAGWLGPGRLVDDVTVVIDGGRVAFAGPSRELAVVASTDERAERLGGGEAPPEPDEEIRVDGFVMPGVVDRHVHIALSDPAAVLRGGVTAVRDLAWPPRIIHPIAEASEGVPFQGPLIRAVGPMITCPGGYPTRAAWAPSGTGVEVDGPDEAVGAVGDVLGASSASVVKVAMNSDAGPVLADDELVAVCDAAHAAGAIVTAHVQGVGQAERAVRAGVDEFAHCPWSERLPDGLIVAMARRTRIVSTLDIHSYGRESRELHVALENLRRFLEAGGRVAYGTDLGNGPIPAGIHVGEVRHLVRAGLTPEQVLEAVTFRPLAPGEPGDLIALSANPLEDAGAFGRVALVVRAGRRVG